MLRQWFINKGVFQWFFWGSVFALLTQIAFTVNATPLQPIQVKQGDIFVMAIQLEEGISFVQGRFLGNAISFYKNSNDLFEALVGVDLAAPLGTYSLEIEWDQKGVKGTTHLGKRDYVIEVKSGGFGTQTLTLPKKMVDLDQETLDRVHRESERFKELFRLRVEQKLWEGAFVIPAEGPRMGSFGVSRIMNGEARNPHTGEDIGAPLGAPVRATQSGTVVLVGDFYFNGRSVVIAHGLGLFSMYFHLKDIFVKEGQSVKWGEKVATVGQSGRATGPHLHWGVRLNDARVNPFSLMEFKALF